MLILRVKISVEKVDFKRGSGHILSEKKSFNRALCVLIVFYLYVCVCLNMNKFQCAYTCLYKQWLEFYSTKCL